MSDAEKIVFKSTLTKVIAYTIGVISVCSTCIWGVTKITNALALHEYKIEEIVKKEASHEESDNRLHAEMWRSLKEEEAMIFELKK